MCWVNWNKNAVQLMAHAGGTCNLIKLQVLHGAKWKAVPSVPECVTSCQAELEKHN